MPTLGKLLIISGAFLIALGLLFCLFGKVPFLGRLPGDIYIEKKNFTVYFPLATCLVISLFLTLFIWFLSRR
jgi:hypothetical protein